MSNATAKLPKWLQTAITKYSIAKPAAVRDVFEAYLENDTLDSPRFQSVVERLVKRKTVKQKFFDVLEAQGHFDVEEEEDETAETEELLDDESEEEEDDSEDDEEEEELEDDEDVDLEDDEDDEEEEELEDEEDEEEDEEDDLEDDDEEVLEDDDDDDDDEEEEEEEEDETPEPTAKRGRGRPKGSKNKTTTKQASQYDETGVPSVSEVRALVGDDYTHREEFEDPTDLLITVGALNELGFDLEYDARLDGGTIQRQRGGRFVLEVNVSEKRAVKRRGKVAPVFAFTGQIVDTFNLQRDALIAQVISDAITADEENEADE